MALRSRINAWIAAGMLKYLHVALLNSGKIMFGAFKQKLHEQCPDAPLSPIYINIRELPDHLYVLTGEILYDLAVREEIGDFDYVIGIPKAGEPIGCAFAEVAGKPLLRIEKAESAESRRITSKILDPFEKGKRVVLVDDLIAHGRTKLEAIQSVEENELRVVATLVLYDREQGGFNELNGSGHKICAAAKLSEMLQFFVDEEKIDEAKMREVMTYIAAN